MNYVEDMVRVMEQRATTAVFAVPGRAVVPTTGVGVRLTIGQWEMPLATTLEVYPAQSANAQIMGAVTNPATAPWLPGPVRIAVGEELIGATTLAFTAPHETTSLWLGIDDSIRVTRTLEERTRAAGTRTLELSMKWNTQLLSTSAQEKSLTVIEPLPLSEDERIEVELDRPEPRTPIQQGVARWELVLPPRGKQNLSVGWTITAPLGSKIAGLEPAELTRIR